MKTEATEKFSQPQPQQNKKKTQHSLKNNLEMSVVKDNVAGSSSSTQDYVNS